MRIFVGITGASGAPYAARLIETLGRAEHEVLLCASRAGIQVLATELYGDAHLSADETLARVVEPVRSAVTIHDERDWRSPAASGSARIDGYVVCPCSMGTLGAIASGTMSNLIQRAASVALKEGRKLVLMPRETPLSTIHLEGMLAVRRAGATVLFLAPGFYHGWERVEQLLDFVVGRCLDQLGVENTLVPEWGAAQPPVRESGRGEGVWENREVPPAE